MGCPGRKMITGLRGKRKKPTDIYLCLGSLLINALKKITPRVINYAALSSLSYYPAQTAPRTLSHAQANEKAYSE